MLTKRSQIESLGVKFIEVSKATEVAPGVCATGPIERKFNKENFPKFFKIDSEDEATEVDWSTEYLDAIISVRIVDGIDQAISHIAKYGSSHTESIITENTKNAEKFLNEVDSAIVMHNASTQYADGGEFGMGAEIGISTGKIHARGPVGLQQLTSYKYQVRGNGQIRPE